ncbi:hypothetical protein K4L06_14425 [Lysobacter sp. BMK333-48F3]|uniref:RHS repeat protein n=1 Tax=Lysobacter sp. BMK333-48F3 TaxID=2867962 RepID=UPI001C8B3B97|nr:RHS repeat protein [Lysobacter sp. BMK333-48F3]MBX9402505.1 hypothetical protein [Lysobacter sp. BMK333-48F3]
MQASPTHKDRGFWLRRALPWLAFFGLALVLGSVRAQGTDWPNEYAKRVRSTEHVSPLSDEAFGDKVNLFNGTVRFSHDLVSLPGNSALPVALGIFYDPHDITGGPLNGYWDLDLPYVGAVHHSKSAEANGWVAIPPNVNNGYVEFDRSIFWSGNRLTINGGGGGDLLTIPDDPKRVKPQNSVGYKFATKDGWFFAELPSVQNGPGKGLVGYAPDGTKYTFDWLVYRRYSSISHPWGYTVPNALLHRYKLKLYVSKIEDRFGNWVRYDWEYDHPTRIYANDGREIVMTYSSPAPYLFDGNYQTNIKTATANGRTWTFDYANAYGGNVRNPDGSEWKFDGPAVFDMPRLDVAEYLINPDNNQHYPQKNVPCSPGSILADTRSKVRIVHPSGAAAEYLFKSMRHGRTNVPYICETGNDEGSSGRNRYSTFHDTWSLIEKRISGAGIAEKVYRYGYEGLGEGYETQDENRWDIGPGWNAKYAPPAPNYKTVTVTEPDGTQNLHTFGRDRDLNEGQLFRVETRKAGTTYRSVSNSYVSDSEAAGMPFPSWMGSNGDEFADRLPNSNRPLKSTVTAQDGATFNRSINSFDAQARPLSVAKWSSGSHTDRGRTDATEYYDDLGLWVLGQVRKESNTDTGWVMSQTDYNAQALPSQRFAFGKPIESYEYNPDGTLAALTDGAGRKTRLENWKRGVPQSIRYADQNGDSAVVDDNGWLTSITDENGYTTGYAYDAMGRLQTVSYPGADSNAWEPMQLRLEQRGQAEYGLPGGHWRQSVTVGRRNKHVYLDAMFRPVLTHEFDGNDFAGTLKAGAAAFDEDNRVVFASYPSRQPAGSTQGTRTAYDALGRVTSVQQDSELGVLTTTTEYLPQFLTRVTNPRQQQTWYSYFVLDQPSYDTLTGITHPGGRLTWLYRDLLGAITSLRRTDSAESVQLLRQYGYDIHHQLCKTVEPETGATVTAYTATGKVAWSASGLSLPDTGNCNHMEAYQSGRRVDRSYDARDRLYQLSFPDGAGNQTWSYYPDGQVQQVTTHNGATGDSVVNSYEYNKRRLPTRERMQFDAIDWAFGSTYDNEGALASHSYPNGQAVAYAPNGLGQPTQAGSYATGVAYHPNGGMSGFAYGNGIVHSLQQNLRGLPERSRDAGSATVLDDSYDYDAVGNVAAISDGLPGARGDRSLGYDGADRLTSAVSPMFGPASYSYDAFDNLRTVEVAGRKHTYYYDGANRLTNVQLTDTGQSVIGLGYDVQGNLQNKNGKEFRFDFGNRLREAVGAESYRYDAHGRRVLATSPSLGSIVSMYDQGGALRYQRDYRKEKDVAYFSLNGSLVARASTAIAPDVPVLTAPSFVSAGSFTVGWSQTTAQGSYELQEQAGGGAWQALYSGGERSRTVSGRSDGSYGYRVRACNAVGCGGWSATATVVVQRPPSSAPSLSAPATAVNGQYGVSWTSAGGATDYLLEESAGGAAWTTAYAGADLSKAFSGRAGGSYSYRVKGCNPAGCGPVSNTASVQVIYPPASAPSISAPAQSTQGSFSVGWTAVAGAAGYQLEQNALGQGWALIQDGGATSRTIYGGSTGNYAYRVRACNAAGCGPTSGEANVYVIGPPTAAPGISVPASSNNGTFWVGWNGVDNATRYQLEESAGGGAWTLIYEANTGGATIWGRWDGTYGYRVRGCNDAGCGPYSSPGFITVDHPPAAPSINLADWLRNTLRGRVVLDTCTIRWNAVAKASSYQLQSTDNGAQLYSGSATQIQSGSSGQYCAYNYAVRACGSGGCSAWSSPPYPATRRTEAMD